MDISTNFLNIAVLCVFATFFTERVVDIWNSLPSVVDFNSLAVFKCTFKCVRFSSHLRFNCHYTLSTIQFVGCCKCTFVPCCPVSLLILHIILFLLERIKWTNEWTWQGLYAPELWGHLAVPTLLTDSCSAQEKRRGRKTILSPLSSAYSIALCGPSDRCLLRNVSSTYIIHHTLRTWLGANIQFKRPVSSYIVFMSFFFWLLFLYFLLSCYLGTSERREKQDNTKRLGLGLCFTCQKNRDVVILLI